MTLISERRKARLRRVFRKKIHNDKFRVNVFIDEALVQPNPQVKGQMVKRHAEFNNFEASVYANLSGKIGRIFRNIVEFPHDVLGLLDQAAWLLQYVPNLYNLEAVTSASTNVAPSATQLEDSVENFQTLPIRVGAQVYNITDNSRAIVTAIAAHTITTTALSGGSSNLFTAGDDYNICNSNELQADDKVFHLNRWRTVLHVIPDSTGVQTTVLLGD